MKLEGASAFATLGQIVTSVSLSSDDIDFAEPAFERLATALKDTNGSPLDIAILLRQALLYEAARRGEDSIKPEIRISHDHLLPLEKVSLFGVMRNQHVVVTAERWAPKWLQDANCGVDNWSSAETQRRVDQTCEADPFLSILGLPSYRSRRQRGAVRAVLSTPPGCTLTVILSTGEGKSLLFQLIDKIGFVDASGAVPTEGVTIVIVPTIALAIDHQNSKGDDIPRAWFSDNFDQNTRIAAGIRDGSQGLCFASPESACGAMRPAIVDAAKAGHLKALVIDEAHMVDAWGTGFRTAFQTLSGLHAEILSIAPPDVLPRTICLSATMTESARKTIQALFPGRDYRTFSAATLRPEPDFWISVTADADERWRRVLDAMLHVPRAAILYATEVQEAKKWYRSLIECGFKRIRLMHGGTSRNERAEIMNGWRGGSVDVVVATSAFGLGINLQHVRSIVHACVPESLDRYYQEVGRGGRDGRGCLSLVIPSYGDHKIASKLNSVSVISLPRGMERWQSMFDGPKRQIGTDSFEVRLDVAPGSNAHDIGMLNETSTDWNARVLTLLARAGMIRLLGETTTDRVEEPGTWQSLEILDHGHLDMNVWERRVKPVRDVVRAERTRTLDLMERMLLNDVCPASIFLKLYEDAKPTCSRCNRCRITGCQPFPTLPDFEPIVPWPSNEISRQLGGLFDHGNRIIVVIDGAGPLMQRELAATLLYFGRRGFSKIVLRGHQSHEVEHAILELKAAPIFVLRSKVAGATLMPTGPEILIYGPEETVSRHSLMIRPAGSERIVFVHKDARRDDRLDVPLQTIHDGRVVMLDYLYSRSLL